MAIEDNKITRLQEWSDREARKRDGGSTARPTIEIAAGEIPRMVEQAQRALIAMGAGIYQRGGMLVRVSVLDRPEKLGSVTRPAGSALIMAVTKEYLTLANARSANWRKYDGRSREFRPADPPSAVSASILSASGEWLFPELRGIIGAPTLRPDGSILQAPGFDEASGLFFFDDGTKFPEIPAQPTREDALQALQMLDEVIEEFEFEDGASGAHASVALAAIISAVIRHALRTAPGVGLNGHKAGSGKTTLGHTIARIPTGRDAAVMPFDGEESEVRKLLLAVLLAADLIVLVDNVAAPIDSAAICAALTSAVYKDRVLGVSRTASVPTAATFLFNGNNLEFVGDLTSRIVLCTLDPQCEQPEARAFKRDLSEFVSARRGELVKAALTVPLAYLAAGEPNVEAARSRFSDWDRFVRRPLLWLERADPLSTQADLRTLDPVRGNLIALLASWREHFGDAAASVADVIEVANWTGMREKPQLREALINVCGERNGDFNSRRLGRYLVRHVRRREEDLRFECAGKDPITKRPLYKVVNVASVSGVSGVSANPSRDNCNFSNRTGNNTEYAGNAEGFGQEGQ